MPPSVINSWSCKGVLKKSTFYPIIIILSHCQPFCNSFEKFRKVFLLILYEYSYLSKRFIIIVVKKPRRFFMNSSKTNKTRQRKGNHRSKASDSALQNGFLHTLKSSLFGSAIGIVCAFALMMIGAFVCYSSPDPHKLTGAVSLAALYLSSLVSGFTAVRRNRSSALLCGGLSGAFLMLFFIICSLFFDLESAFDFPISILLRVCIIATAALGGYAGLKRNTNKRKTHKPNR